MNCTWENDTAHIGFCNFSGYGYNVATRVTSLVILILSECFLSPQLFRIFPYEPFLHYHGYYKNRFPWPWIPRLVCVWQRALCVTAHTTCCVRSDTHSPGIDRFHAIYFPTTYSQPVFARIYSYSTYMIWGFALGEYLSKVAMVTMITMVAVVAMVTIVTMVTTITMVTMAGNHGNIQIKFRISPTQSRVRAGAWNKYK